MPIETPILPRARLSSRVWMDLVFAAHTEPTRAFKEYAQYYKTTSGQIHWSDLHQFSNYREGYHDEIDHRMRARQAGSDVITEIYVPRHRLTHFMADARDGLQQKRVSVIYGTIRLIERDEESYLAWAREPYACVIFNLHTAHSTEGIAQSAETFRNLIDFAICHQGTYYLTYHKFATRKQVESCHPRFREFLAIKRQIDPEERFQSDWYRHYRQT